MYKTLISTTYLLSLLLTPLAYANTGVEVTFRESAPKDSFIFKNTSKCNLENLVLNIDLSKSAGRLIFDTTATGAGVEVFQPFEVLRGDITLASASSVKDGDKKLSLNVKKLAPNESVSFTIDLDDTLAKSSLGNIRISDSEIKGGMISLSLTNQKSFNATFNNDAKALIQLADCNS